MSRRGRLCPLVCVRASACSPWSGCPWSSAFALDNSHLIIFVAATNWQSVTANSSETPTVQGICRALWVGISKRRMALECTHWPINTCELSFLINCTCIASLQGRWPVSSVFCDSFFHMKIVCTDGRFWDYKFPVEEKLDAALLEQMLAHHCKPDGKIDCLCLDFAGQYVALESKPELRLASALVVAWHNMPRPHDNRVCHV